MSKSRSEIIDEITEAEQKAQEVAIYDGSADRKFKAKTLVIKDHDGKTVEWIPKSMANAYATTTTISRTVSNDDLHSDKETTFYYPQRTTGDTKGKFYYKSKSAKEYGTYTSKRDKQDGEVWPILYSDISFTVPATPNGKKKDDDDDTKEDNTKETKLITKTITENGTYSAKDDGASGYSSVTVNVEAKETGGGESGGSKSETGSDDWYVGNDAGTVIWMGDDWVVKNGA